MPYMYILKCADGSFYTGSTVNLEKRIWEHNNDLGANHTKSRLPVELVFCEEFAQIDEAFYKEKQVQGWSRAKKIALIARRYEDLPALALNSSAKVLASTGSATVTGLDSELCRTTANTTFPEPVEGISKPACSELVSVTELVEVVEAKDQVH
jgi:putative endonuclease